MNLRARQVGPDDYKYIYRFTFETFNLRNLEAETKSEWEILYRAKKDQGMAMFGIVVEDIGNLNNPIPIAYQQIRFVSEQFFDSYRTNMPGWLLVQAKKILDQGFLPGLTEDELLLANEQNQVHLLIDYYGWDEKLSARDSAIARDYLFRSFQWLCRGYNLQTILIETVGQDSLGTLLAKNAGFRPVRSLSDGPIFHAITRDEALRGASLNSMVAALFAGGTPRLRLTSFDRCLILAALWGFSDDSLASIWPCSEDTIGTYWSHIHKQVEKDVPGIFSQRKPAVPGKRGTGLKEPLLNFLRNNPHELGPVVYLPLEWRERPRNRRTDSIV